MGFFTSPIKTMDDLYLHQLQDIYYAEKQITKALPKMIAKTGNPALKQAFQTHLGETEKQVTRLEEAFRILGKDAKTLHPTRAEEKATDQKLTKLGESNVNKKAA